MGVRSFRALSLGMVVVLGVAACSSTAYDPNLTPEENKIRQRADQFNDTLAEGAVAGALLGALIGGLAAKNHGEGAAIGAASGAALGVGLGYAVASNTEAQQQTEDQYQAAIQQAQKTANEAKIDAQTARAAAQQAQKQLADMNRQLAQKKISADAYQKKLDSLQSTDQSLRKLIAKYKDHTQSMYRYAQARRSTSMAHLAVITDRSVSEMEQAESVLATGLGQQPAQGGTLSNRGTSS
ncbi:glycine zipper domain-containing protein [Entomobacter blattae]|uniref:Glycine zipper domain-containing protein n=1 Tax=Entomobacter blattae TaxID=2762277 RepID=A0A7H1NQC0_9PROT|nr:glycine zipper domain-containing protein [Entomobacter blattae]QNT77980.1 hypothetical protein JGUZn3_07450 [Entomobacter blattae]